MIVVLIMLLIMLGGLFFLSAIILFTYYRENKIWNNGTCELCNTPWKIIKPPIQIYQCNCRIAAFIVKVTWHT